MPTAARQTSYPVLAIASGKGGVGKSTVSFELAMAMRRQGLKVGLLDADVYGPNLPTMVNLRRSAAAKELTLHGTPRLRQRLEPLDWLGCKMMSVGFLLGENQALGQPAQIVDLLVMRILTMVVWGDIDVLIVDLPPGTGDVQQQVVTHAPGLQAVVVVTPQDVAHADAGRMVEFFKSVGVPVLGGITNMADIVCPCCEQTVALWREPLAEHSLWAHGIEELVRIPFFPPASAQLSSVVRQDVPESAATATFDGLAVDLSRMLGLADRAET